MKRVGLLLLLFFVAGCVGQKAPGEELPSTEVKELTITSPAFQNDGYIPSKYTCDGENINPPLEIEGIPEGTESLVLIIDDPDAPRGMFNHWVVWNISPANTIGEDTIPGTEGINGFGRHGYGGPCPPSGTHRYIFRVYALDSRIDLNSDAKKNEVEEAIKSHILAQGELIGLYSRGQPYSFLYNLYFILSLVL